MQPPVLSSVMVTVIGVQFPVWSRKAWPLWLVFARKLRPAVRFQRCQVDLHDLPWERRRNLPVFVAHHVSDSGNLPPRDVGISSFHRVRQPAAGLGHDLDPALDNPLLLPILLEFVKRCSARLFADVFNCLDNICQLGRNRRQRHQNKRSAVAWMLGRRTLWMLSRVMTSASWPRMRDTYSCTSISSNSPNFPS
jgi:hypothetical protein